MNIIREFNYKLLLSCSLVTLPVIAASQTYKFEEFGLEEGICDRYIYTINQDDKGYLWIGTGTGICRFDGFDFRGDLLPDTLTNSSVTASFKDSNGNLWFGHIDGNITFYNGSDFISINIKEKQKNRINDITESKNGNIYFATQSSGIIQLNPSGDFITKSVEIKGKLIYSIEQVANNKFLTGTNSGLEVYNLNENDSTFLSFSKKVEQIPEVKIQSLLKRSDQKVIIATENNGIFIINTESGPNSSFSVRKIRPDLNLENLNIQSLFEDVEGNIWISTFRDGILKLGYSNNEIKFIEKQRYNTSNGLVTNDIKSVFQDLEGNIWIGTYGSGIAKLENEAFTFYNYDNNKYGSNVLSLENYQEELWLGTNKGVILTVNEQIEKFYSSLKYFENDKISSLFVDQKGNTWIGTSENGIYLINRKTDVIKRIFYSGNDLENSINYITGSGNRTWVATRSGVLLFYDERLKRHFTTNEGLPHNSISHIFLNNEGNAWISTISRKMFYITDEGLIKSGREVGVYGRNEFNGIVQDTNNYFWAATYGSGIYFFSSDTIYNLRVGNGLKSDYCYSLLCDESNNIWVGHRQGFSKISADSLYINTFGKEIGVVTDCNLNSILLDNSGNVIFGTNSGLIKYDPGNDQKSLRPPFNNLISVEFNDNEIDWNEKVVLPYGRYKLNIDFLGISLNNPEKVTYQYKLENYDLDWSDRTLISEASYPRIEDGNYNFKLLSFNSEGNSIRTPLSFQFVIKKPFWKKWWFILSATGFLVFTMIFIVKVRERNHKKLQAYLEKELNERTKEVVEKKNEIEEKNQEITDSINYAQRIQSSILPSIKLLEESFSGSFMYYKPRDIVSGDFYWFDKIDDEKLIIVCADSTGHGVPGAFMSMIGSTLIKDIVNRREVDSPSKIMHSLDREITQTLTQNVDSESAQDGMDMIVCEINLKTNYLRFSSAMRPVILYMKDEQYYIRGNRSSVGGEVFEDKTFDDQEYQLQKGDIIYMFSDGYPDQFGGPAGKKFKMVRLKNMLDSIHNKKMSEQYDYIKNNFDLWKSDMWQVDDVLFMGIQI